MPPVGRESRSSQMSRFLSPSEEPRMPGSSTATGPLPERVRTLEAALVFSVSHWISSAE